MFTKGFLSGLLISLIILGTSLPITGWAGEPSPKPTLTDIALSEGGILEGQVVDLQNIGQPGVPVSIRSQDRDVASTTTAVNGRFVVQDLRGGVYHVAAPKGDGVFRLWAPRTAPPAAKKHAIVYVQNQYAMGGDSGLKRLLGHPIVIPAVIATAIAVPIAVSANQQPSSP
ncbi:MAG TPA: carboxypeptidase-like regulatory domain-containing protein [Thermoguttaceae bacterium]